MSLSHPQLSMLAVLAALVAIAGALYWLSSRRAEDDMQQWYELHDFWGLFNEHGRIVAASYKGDGITRIALDRLNRAVDECDIMLGNAGNTIKERRFLTELRVYLLSEVGKRLRPPRQKPTTRLPEPAVIGTQHDPARQAQVEEFRAKLGETPINAVGLSNHLDEMQQHMQEQKLLTEDQAFRRLRSHPSVYIAARCAWWPKGYNVRRSGDQFSLWHEEGAMTHNWPLQSGIEKIDPQYDPQAKQWVMVVQDSPCGEGTPAKVANDG